MYHCRPGCYYFNSQLRADTRERVISSDLGVGYVRAPLSITYAKMRLNHVEKRITDKMGGSRRERKQKGAEEKNSWEGGREKTMGVGKLSWNSQQLELQTPPFSPLPLLSLVPFPLQSLSLPPSLWSSLPVCHLTRQFTEARAQHQKESSGKKETETEGTRSA